MITDTSFLVALFLKDDDLHKLAIDKFNLMSEEIVVLDRVFEETFTVLTYKKGIEYGLEVLNKIESNKEFSIYKINDIEWISTIEFMKKLKRKLSFVDYLVIYFALKNHHNKILSFDKEMNKVINSIKL